MKQVSAFENSMTQLAQSAAILKSEYRSPKQKKRFEEKIERLKFPEKVIEVSLPVKKDDGSTQIFTGYRSQYSSVLGPYKGGIRFHPNVSLDEVKALSFWMSVKCSVAGIPMGGGKGGVIVDPKSLSQKELERLSRAYVKAISHDIGPYVDVPAPDVNTNPQIMSWMVDEFAKQTRSEGRKVKGQKSRGLVNGETLATFTGKPVDKGGSKSRTEATARGGLYILQELLRRLKKVYPLKKDKPFQRTVAVQGMGNVGGIFARLASEAGFKVVAISDSKGGVYNPQGLDLPVLQLWKDNKGSLAGFPGVNNEQITNNQLLELPVDILVPAALENVITENNAPKIKAKVILELANGPTTTQADEILTKKKIMVVPDFLANSGGVTVSYFEWFQNLHNVHWTEKQANLKLKDYMEKAFAKVWKSRLDYKVDLRTAAYIVSLHRILKVMK